MFKESFSDRYGAWLLNADKSKAKTKIYLDNASFLCCGRIVIGDNSVAIVDKQSPSGLAA